jgi:hypothetical protein
MGSAYYKDSLLLLSIDHNQDDPPSPDNPPSLNVRNPPELVGLLPSLVSLLTAYLISDLV